MSTTTPAPMDTNDFAFGELAADDFVRVMKFLDRNELWDQVSQHFQSEGITKIPIGAAPLISIKKFIIELLGSKSRRDKLNTTDLQLALFLGNCGCLAGCGGSCSTLPTEAGTEAGTGCTGGVMTEGSSCTPPH